MEKNSFIFFKDVTRVHESTVSDDVTADRPVEILDDRF